MLRAKHKEEIMKKLITLVGAFVILACAPAFIEPVEIEIEGTAIMEGRLTVENVTTGETHILDNAKTDRLINEMLEALSTGEFDEVGMIAFIYRWIQPLPYVVWWDTVYLPTDYDGGAYDTCNWVRWRVGWRPPDFLGTGTILYWYLLPGIVEIPLSEAYATEPENLQFGWGDSLAVTWTYVQHGKPE